MSMASAPQQDSRSEIRRRLRAQRRALRGSARRDAQKRLTRVLARLPAYRRARNLAVYFGIDGEVELDAVITDALQRRKRVFVPVLAPRGLRFTEIPKDGALRPNRYGIPEPRDGRRLAPSRLDLVLTPLVAFDRRGTRLGMGKAYYDRTFEFLIRRTRWIRPKLIGVAFAFQEQALICAEPWDVRLWAVVTELGTIPCRAASTT